MNYYFITADQYNHIMPFRMVVFDDNQSIVTTPVQAVVLTLTGRSI